MHAIRFRFPSVNFTTAELTLEVCGLAGLGPQNNDGGNPIEGLESLLLLGTLHAPKGLVTDPKLRVAYVPNPHFVGADSFDYRGDDDARPCRGLECEVRQDRRTRTILLNVENINDAPVAARSDVTGK
jgi:hypothetical protein